MFGVDAWICCDRTSGQMVTDGHVMIVMMCMAKRLSVEPEPETEPESESESMTPRLSTPHDDSRYNSERFGYMITSNRTAVYRDER